MKHGSKCSTQLGRNRQEPDMDKEHHEYRNTGMNSILDEEAAFYTMQSHFCESIPSSIRTLVGSMPSANFVRLRAFNILQHPSTSLIILSHLPTPLGTSAPRLLGHFCMSSGCHSWFCHFCSCIAHCSIALETTNCDHQMTHRKKT